MVEETRIRGVRIETEVTMSEYASFVGEARVSPRRLKVLSVTTTMMFR